MPRFETPRDLIWAWVHNEEDAAKAEARRKELAPLMVDLLRHYPRGVQSNGKVVWATGDGRVCMGPSPTDAYALDWPQKAEGDGGPSDDAPADDPNSRPANVTEPGNVVEGPDDDDPDSDGIDITVDDDDDHPATPDTAVSQLDTIDRALTVPESIEAANEEFIRNVGRDYRSERDQIVASSGGHPKLVYSRLGAFEARGAFGFPALDREALAASFPGV